MKLLIVEDDDGVSLVLRKILSQLPHSSIVQVQTWREMEEALRSETYDVLLLDLGLPDSPSEDTNCKIRKLKMDNPNMAVCVITGQPYYDENTVKKAGADDFMHKADAFGGPAALIQKVSSLFHRFSTKEPMKRLENQVSLLQQATHATIEEMNREEE